MTSLVSVDFDSRLRQAAMEWLGGRCTPDNPVIHRKELEQFHFEGQRISLVDRGQGIRKPKQLAAALTIMTTYVSDKERAPYEDAIGEDGFLRYKYRGDDPQHSSNRALREAHVRQLPIIWFFGVEKSVYLPLYPAWIVADEPERLQIAVGLSQSQIGLPESQEALSPLERKYVARISKQRLHQPVFRQRVIQAYGRSCTVCRLQHVSLLDAAHIVPDREDRGVPAISNGLALCKIHHAAYDANIIGISPRLIVHVRPDILHEVDGPMLRHGLQEMDGVAINLPSRRIDQPNPLAIEQRFEAFRDAS